MQVDRAIFGLLALLVPFAAGALPGCGGHPPDVVVAPKAPAPTVTALPPPPPEIVSTVRPASVAAWVHVENVPAWMTFLGVPQDAPQSEGLTKTLMAGLLALDLTRAFDVGLIYVSDDDFEVAAAIPISDKERFLDLVRQTSDVTERKSRYIIKTKKSDKDATPDPASATAPEPTKKKKTIDDKTFACDFVASPPQAICGSERGLSELAPWLRSGPKPPKGDFAFELYVEPMRAMMLAAIKKPSDTPTDLSNVDAETARKQAEESAKLNEQAAAFVDELDRFTFWALLKDQALELGLSTAFRTTESAWVKPIFATPTDIGRPELLFKLSENASAAIYSQGGGPLPGLMSSFDPWTDLTGADHAKAVALTEDLKQLLMKPYGAAYGIDEPRVTKAIAELKIAKDPDKSKKALASAIDGYGLLAFTTDAPTLEKMIRELTRLSEIEAKQNPATASSDAKAKTTIRPAPASFGLPKGSFFLDETKMIPGKKPKDPKKKEVKTTALCFSDAHYAYVVLSLSDDRIYADTAKEILKRKVTPRALDPMFDRKGILLGGQVTSLVGAFGSHELLLKEPGKLDAAAKTKLIDDLEHDLAAPRLPVPFALTAQRTGAAATLSFEVKGEKTAFTTIFEHALSGVGALLMLPLMMAMMKP